MAETIRNGLYALAVAIVASTIIFSWSLTSSASTLSEGLVKSGLGSRQVVAAPQAGGSAPVPTPEPRAAAPRPTGKVDLKDGAAKGEAGAKVALVEYSDFQCPFCSRFFQQTLGQLESEYVKTGRVKFVYKNFPLDSIHPQARPAAIAFECGRKLGGDEKAFALHDKMFANQAQLGDDNYKKWAGEVGLDASAFSSCYDKRETEGLVDAQFSEGSQNGIAGTPGFLITDPDGKVLDEISGAQPFTAFKAVLDRALAA